MLPAIPPNRVNKSMRTIFERPGWTFLIIMTIVGVAYGIGFDRYQWFPYSLARHFYLQLPFSQNPMRATGDLEYIQSRTAFFRQIVGKSDVIMLGASLTEQAGDWRDFFPDLDVRNRGVGGDTTKGILDRLDEVLSRQPRVVALLIGLNDVRMGVDHDTIVSNIKQTLLRLKQAGVRPIMQSTLPPSARLREWNAAAAVRKLNSILKECCATEGIDFLDLN